MKHQEADDNYQFAYFFDEVVVVVVVVVAVDVKMVEFGEFLIEALADIKVVVAGSL